MMRLFRHSLNQNRRREREVQNNTLLSHCEMGGGMRETSHNIKSHGKGEYHLIMNEKEYNGKKPQKSFRHTSVCQDSKTAFSRANNYSALTKEKTPQSIGITTFLASWKGLEPPACRLGGDRSIQLSYQDVYEIVCQIIKDVHALRRLALYPAELRAHMKLVVLNSK